MQLQLLQVVIKWAYEDNSAGQCKSSKEGRITPLCRILLMCEVTYAWSTNSIPECMTHSAKLWVRRHDLVHDLYRVWRKKTGKGVMIS